MNRQPLLFTYWLLKYPVFWLTYFPTQSVRLPTLVTYFSLCSTCATYRTPCHFIDHQVLPTQPLTREAGHFLGGDKHSKNIPLVTCQAWLQPIINKSRLIFKKKTVEKTLIKNHIIVAALINSLFNQLSIILISFK